MVLQILGNQHIVLFSLNQFNCFGVDKLYLCSLLTESKNQFYHFSTN